MVKKIVLALFVVLLSVSIALAQANPFSPDYGTGVSLSVTDSSGATTAQLGFGTSVLVANDGSNEAYVKIGPSTVSAGTSDLPVLPDSYVLVNRNKDNDFIAAVCNSGETTTLRIISGYGM